MSNHYSRYLGKFTTNGMTRNGFLTSENGGNNSYFTLFKASNINQDKSVNC